MTTKPEFVKKILYSTEFSDHAKHVLRYAVELAKTFEATLLVMHGFGKPDVRITGEDKQEKARKVIQRLEEFVEKNVPDHKLMNIELVAEYGYPADSVLEASEKHDADLIVLGMQGSNKAMERQVGSTAREIIRRSEDRMIMAIPATARYEGFHNLAFATSFEFRDFRALKVIKEIADLFESQIHIVYVVERPGQKEMARQDLETLTSLFRDVERMEFRLLEGDIRSELEAYVSDEKIAMLGMMSHRKGFWKWLTEGSVTREMVGELHVPLLIFRD